MKRKNGAAGKENEAGRHNSRCHTHDMAAALHLFDGT
jgi:hypothetical protein